MAVVALLTDFGTRDYYVAAMKATVLTLAPDTTLVDITHDIPPQDIGAAAFELRACCLDFPPRTIFLVVVDPGVGSGRRALVVASRGRVFVGPDNGVLEPALDASPGLVVELANPQFARPQVSRTFEGRDRFAPAAAWLARGTDIRAFGPVVSNPARLTTALPRREGGQVYGEIVKVDRFGNLVSNIDGRSLEAARRAGASVLVAGTELRRMVNTYGEVSPGELCALVGSSGFLEISVNGGSAAERLGTGRGSAIVVTGVAGPEP